MFLRPATAEDIAPLARLGRDSFVAKFGHLYRAEDLAGFLDTNFTESSIAAELANPGRLYQLAERDGALVGYCKIALATGFPEHARGRRVMELKQLYTDPAQTGQGIGTALMDWAMAQFTACGADEVHLSVYAENFGAQHFYQRHGFAKLADTFFIVGTHRDEEYLFAKLLNPL